VDNQVAKFWNDFEMETGEKVEAQSEGNWFRAGGNPAGHEGLLILTDKSFRFKYVVDAPRPFMNMDVSAEHEDESEFTIARSEIVSVRTPKKGFFSWLTGRGNPHCSVVVHDKNGEKTYEFSVDISTGLIEALRKGWPAAAASSIH
jgi:hypothetical protein